MKEATGELNLTVITLIAIGLVIGVFYVMWPRIQEGLNSQWNGISNGPKVTPTYIVLENKN